MRTTWAILLVIRAAMLPAVMLAAQVDEALLARSPQEAFRTGIDLVQLDVSVLDRDGRPVRGLTADDFTVLENGRPQPIVAFTPIDVPPPSTPRAPWMRDVPVDIVSNEQETRRIVVIVMNDGFTGTDRGESTSARTVARTVIDQLGPADLAAVVFTFMGTNQNFTTDRVKLRKAIESFVPRNSADAGVPLGCGNRRGGCAVDTLVNIATFRRPPRRAGSPSCSSGRPV